MLTSIQDKITQYESANDVHQHALIRDAATLFLELFPTEATPENGYQEGIALIRHLQSLQYLSSMRKYENEYALHNEIKSLKIRVFKRCIPSTHSELRGLTELLIGMKENELN